MPLGSTDTGTSGPSIRRIGVAAFSLTADHASGQERSRIQLSASRGSGPKPVHNEWIVTTVGSPFRVAAHAAPVASGDMIEQCT